MTSHTPRAPQGQGRLGADRDDPWCLDASLDIDENRPGWLVPDLDLMVMVGDENDPFLDDGDDFRPWGTK